MPAPHPLHASDALVHPVYARLLRMLLQQAAVDADQVLAAAQLDWGNLVKDERRLSRDTVRRLATAALSATGRPWLGLELGGGAPISAHGALGYAVVTARDLADSLSVLSRFGALRIDFTSALLPLAHGVVLQGMETAHWGTARNFVLDAVTGSVLRMIHTAVGQWPSGLRVALPMAQPRWAEQYRRFAPVEFCFDQPVLGFYLDHAALALPCIGADTHAHAQACRDCAAELNDLAERSYSKQLERLLANAAPGQYPQLADAALHCGLSSRTLMRQLRADGTSFQLLLDAARKTRALWLLQHSTHSMEDIAAELGFADTSNFSRTMRRWFGVNPRTLSQRLRAR